MDWCTEVGSIIIIVVVAVVIIVAITVVTIIIILIVKVIVAFIILVVIVVIKVVTISVVLIVMSLVDIFMTVAAIATITRKFPTVVVVFMIVIFTTRTGHQAETIAVARWKFLFVARVIVIDRASLRGLPGKITVILKSLLPGPSSTAHRFPGWHDTEAISIAMRWLLVVVGRWVARTATMGMLASELAVVINILRPGAGTTDHLLRDGNHAPAIAIAIGALQLVFAVESFARVSRKLVYVVVALVVAVAPNVNLVGAGEESKTITVATRDFVAVDDITDIPRNTQGAITSWQSSKATQWANGTLGAAIAMLRAIASATAVATTVAATKAARDTALATIVAGTVWPIRRVAVAVTATVDITLAISQAIFTASTGATLASTENVALAPVAVITGLSKLTGLALAQVGVMSAVAASVASAVIAQSIALSMTVVVAELDTREVRSPIDDGIVAVVFRCYDCVEVGMMVLRAARKGATPRKLLMSPALVQGEI